MALKKFVTSDNERIKLRFKSLNSGNKSIYLDCYSNGKRSYEFLKLYLVPEVDDKSKKANEKTMKLAESIKAQRLKEISTYYTVDDVTSQQNNDKVETEKVVTKDALLLMDAMRIYELCAEQRKSRSTVAIARSTMDAIEAYKGADVLLYKVDKSYCVGFIRYLLTECQSKRGGQITNNTAETFMHCLSSAMDMMVRLNFIKKNPFDLIAPTEKIVRQAVPNVVLSEEELQTLIATPCPVSKRPEVKTAFLFSCYCGITQDDILSLSWGQIKKKDGKSYIDIPSKSISLPLSEDAMRWLPKRHYSSDRVTVFSGLPCVTRIHDILVEWAKMAGIDKHITFRTGRDTFTMMTLKAGNDTYTTTQLLGYKTTKCTDRIIKEVPQSSSDEVEADALSKIDNLFG